MDEKNLKRLLDVLGPRSEWLTAGERRTLEWLSGWEQSTIDNMVSILHKQTQDPDSAIMI